jgi:hypothetical protein
MNLYKYHSKPPSLYGYDNIAVVETPCELWFSEANPWTGVRRTIIQHGMIHRIDGPAREDSYVDHHGDSMSHRYWFYEGREVAFELASKGLVADIDFMSMGWPFSVRRPRAGDKAIPL